MTIRVLIADDHALLRQGFRLVLQAHDDLEVVGEARTGLEAVDRARALRPDVVLMDVRMPDLDGIDATRRLVGELPAVRILILTTFDLDEYAFAGLRAGASGFLLKDTAPDQLVQAVRSVAAGDAVVAPRITRQLLDRFAGALPDPRGPDGGPWSRPGLAALTARERGVLLEVAAGRSNAEIAGRLHLSATTVKTHVARILDKLAVRDRVQVVVLAHELGLVAPGGAPGPVRDGSGC